MKKAEFKSLKQFNSFCKFIVSDNNLYTLYWELDGKKLFLFSNNEILYTIDNLFFVKNADISNNGYIIVSGSFNKNEDEEYVVIFNPQGEKQFNTSVKTRIFNLAISHSGETCIFQTCNSMISEEDNGKIVIIDITNKRIISKFESPLGWPDSYVFYENNKQVLLEYNNNNILFSFFGEFLEPNKIPEKQLSPYDIFYSLETSFAQISESTEHNIIQNLYNQYYSICYSDFTPNVASLTYRHIGELALLLNKKIEALDFFEKAININPKIGLKKKIAELKATLNC